MPPLLRIVPLAFIVYQHTAPIACLQHHVQVEQHPSTRQAILWGGIISQLGWEDLLPHCFTLSSSLMFYILPYHTHNSQRCQTHALYGALSRMVTKATDQLLLELGLTLHGPYLCWKKVSRDLQTVYLSWMVNRCSSCWPKVRPWTLMLGGRISATHCRELRAGDLHST